MTNRDANTRPVARTLKKTNSKPEEIELEFDRPLIINASSSSYHPVAIGVELAGEGRKKRLRQSPGGRLVADYRVQTVSSAWRRISIALDTTAALNQTGIVLVNIPAVAVPEDSTPKISRLRIRCEQRVNPIPLRVKRVELNVLPVIQTETVTQAVIGNSNGLPDQSFYLNLQSLPHGKPPIIKQPIIQVVEESKFEEWNAVENLSSEGPEKKGLRTRQGKKRNPFWQWRERPYPPPKVPKSGIWITTSPRDKRVTCDPD